MREFQIGDRVSRPKNVFRTKSKLMFGRIRLVLRKHDGTVVYDVQWDGDSFVTPGYFQHGLQAAVDAPASKDEKKRIDR